MKLKIYYANEQKIVKIPLSLRNLINRVVKATLENENFKKEKPSCGRISSCCCRFCLDCVSYQ